MSTTALNYRAIRHKTISVNFPDINWKLVYLSGILLFLLLLIFYIFEINELTKGSYLIKNYNKEISSLSQENRILETNFANSGLLTRAIEKAKELNFERTKDIKYVKILESSFAKVENNSTR